MKLKKAIQSLLAAEKKETKKKSLENKMRKHYKF